MTTLVAALLLAQADGGWRVERFVRLVNRAEEIDLATKDEVTLDRVRTPEGPQWRLTRRVIATYLGDLALPPSEGTEPEVRLLGAKPEWTSEDAHEERLRRIIELAQGDPERETRTLRLPAEAAPATPRFQGGRTRTAFERDPASGAELVRVRFDFRESTPANTVRGEGTALLSRADGRLRILDASASSWPIPGGEHLADASIRVRARTTPPR